MGISNLEEGDVVYVVATACDIVRNESIATKAVIVRKLSDQWCRVFMSWKDKTKIVDLPSNMLRKVDGNI